MQHVIRMICVVLGCVGNSAFAQEALAPEVLQRVKQATVFIKATVGPLQWSGSGFVIHTDGETAYLVTNAHVVEKPNLGATVPFPFGFRDRMPLDLRRTQQDIEKLDPQITAVFYSGTPSEQVQLATVVAADSERDLAVLRVAGLKSAPAAIDMDANYRPAETTAVFTFGFPFGEALSKAKGNPAITVGRGAISSLRIDDAGRENAVQIDGALNPGNSGGPVVDARGRLVGVAVATIKGSGIGFAVPPSALQTVLSGGVADVRISQRSNTQPAEFDIQLHLFDPYQKIAAIKVHCAPRAIAKLEKPEAKPLSNSAAVDLVIEKNRATGVWRLSEISTVPDVVTLQPAIISPAGETTYLAISQHRMTPEVIASKNSTPKPLPLPKALDAVPPGRKVLRGAPQKAGEASLSGGILVLGRGKPGIGFGLMEFTPGERSVTYVALYRWPAGEMSRTTSAVSLRRTADAVRITYRAFLDDLEVTTEHAFKPLGTDLQQERLNLQQQEFDPAAGRVFLVDFRREPPRVAQTKLTLPNGPSGESLTDAQLVEFADKLRAQLESSDDAVAKFLIEAK